MMFKLAITAGHWKGTTRGVPASLSPKDHPNEWVLNDRVVSAVIKKLADYDGIKILRIDDPTGVNVVDDDERMRKANAMPADFYLSVHHNGGIGGGTGGGIVAYTYLRDKFKGDNSSAWQKELYEALIRKTGLKGNRAAPLGKADLFECRDTAMPAVLLELGFMDSVTDIKQILAKDFADKCAAAIVSVIVKRAGLTKKKAAAAEPVKTMQKGDKSIGVYTLKKLMETATLLGIALPSGMADDLGFGDGTQKNVKALQALAGLKQTGIADEATIAQTCALLKKRWQAKENELTAMRFQYNGMKEQVKALRADTNK